MMALPAMGDSGYAWICNNDVHIRNLANVAYTKTCNSKVNEKMKT